jgi:predicted acyltransferase
MSDEATASADEGVARAAARVVSVDALRGFDMFWIVGADHFARALGKVSESPVAQTFATQLRHVGWEGFRFYDLIFPLFVFLLGMSTVFSLPKYIAEKGKLAAHVRLLRRFVLLFLLGAFYDSGLSELESESPFSGVLQRMSWCYLFTALCFINLKLRGQIITFFAILIGYWALVSFVPHPDIGEASFGRKENIIDWFDHKFLPMKEKGQYADPEGLLSTLSAVATGLIGLFAGLVIRNPRLGEWKRVGIFLAAGLLLVGLGYGLGYQTPIIKKIWTSSFVLVSGGFSLLLLCFFYLVVDVFKFKKWTIPLVWIGANPLMIYLCSAFIDFHDMAERVVGGPVAAKFGDYGELVITTVGILFVFAFARFLYHKKIFLRV